MAGKAIRWTEAQRAAYVARMTEPLRGAGIGGDHPAGHHGVPIRSATRDRLYPLVLLCEAHRLPLPRPEYAFHPSRGWRFDYAFPDYRIAVEIDGGAWISGRHNRGAGFIEDQRKRNAAAVLGWRVLHYTPDRLAEAIDDLLAILR